MKRIIYACSGRRLMQEKQTVSTTRKT